MQPLDKKRIKRARELLSTIHHIALATVNDDGSPHNTALFMAFDQARIGYWASHPESVHSRNIARDGKAFLLVFDSKEGHGGLFIEAEVALIGDETTARHAYSTLQALKERFYGSMGDFTEYMGGGQRLYQARAKRYWVNETERNQQGVIVRDIRHEVMPSSF